ASERLASSRCVSWTSAWRSCASSCWCVATNEARSKALQRAGRALGRQPSGSLVRRLSAADDAHMDRVEEKPSIARLLATCVLPGVVLAALVSAQAPPVPLPFSNVFSWYAVAADDVVHVLENDYPYATAKYTRSTDHGRTWSTPIPLFVSTALYASGRNLYA